MNRGSPKSAGPAIVRRRTSVRSVAPPTRVSLARLACFAALILPSCGRGSASKPGEPLTVLAVFGEVGFQPGQFSKPRALDVGDGSLWVIDKTARVQRIDPASGECQALWTMPESDLGKPTGITVGPGLDGRPLIYVPDTHYHRVMVYEPPDSLDQVPKLVAQFGEFGRSDSQFIYPTDVAILPSSDGGVERIYVSEYGGNDRISVFGPGVLSGRPDFLFSFNGATSDDRGFDRPQSIVFCPELNELIVTDACNHRIGRFTLDGGLVGWIGSPESAGAEPGAFSYPYGLALTGDGRALVAEFGNCRVQHIDLTTGASLGIYGSPGRDDGCLASPWGVAVLGGMVYVLDTGNNRVMAFRPRERLAMSSRHDGGRTP